MHGSHRLVCVVLFCHGARCGQQSSLTGAVRELGNTVPAHTAVLKVYPSKRGLMWLLVVSRHVHTLPGITGMTLGPQPHAHSGWERCKPPAWYYASPDVWVALRGRVRRSLYRSHRARRNYPQGVGWNRDLIPNHLGELTVKSSYLGTLI